MTFRRSLNVIIKSKMSKMRTNILNVKEFLGDTNKKWKYVVIMTKYSHYFPQPNDYPINLINSTINKFLPNIDNIDAAKNTRDDSSTITVPVHLKDQNSAWWWILRLVIHEKLFFLLEAQAARKKKNPIHLCHS